MSSTRLAVLDLSLLLVESFLIRAAQWPSTRRHVSTSIIACFTPSRQAMDSTHTIHTPDYFPPTTKERLREIALKSHDPRKSLAYFHSKFNDFLHYSTNHETKCPNIEKKKQSRNTTSAPPPLPRPRPPGARDFQNGQTPCVLSITWRDDAINRVNCDPQDSSYD
jgi:hypothetical protein